MMDARFTLQQNILLDQVEQLRGTSRWRGLLTVALIVVAISLMVLTVQLQRQNQRVRAEARTAQTAQRRAEKELKDNLAGKALVAGQFAQAQAAFQAKDFARLNAILSDGRIDAVEQLQDLQATRVGPTPPAATPTDAALAVAPAPASAQGRKVFFQFAGSVQRADVIALNRALHRAGWNVIGSSGEDVNRIPGSARLQQVRYHDTADLPAAQALADALNAARPGKPAVKPQPLRQIYAGTLEIWIS